jgi:hypothetical protein
MPTHTYHFTSESVSEGHPDKVACKCSSPPNNLSLQGKLDEMYYMSPQRNKGNEEIFLASLIHCG